MRPVADARYPLIAPGGDSEALLAQVKEFDAGSDHVVFTDSSFRIPTIYLNDWPDRYIHTTGDCRRTSMPTKLERAGFIGAASALVPRKSDRATICRTLTRAARTQSRCDARRS